MLANGDDAPKEDPRHIGLGSLPERGEAARGARRLAMRRWLLVNFARGNAKDEFRYRSRCLGSAWATSGRISRSKEAGSDTPGGTLFT